MRATSSSAVAAWICARVKVAVAWLWSARARARAGRGVAGRRTCHPGSIVRARRPLATRSAVAWRHEPSPRRPVVPRTLVRAKKKRERREPLPLLLWRARCKMLLRRARGGAELLLPPPPLAAAALRPLAALSEPCSSRCYEESGARCRHRRGRPRGAEPLPLASLHKRRSESEVGKRAANQLHGVAHGAVTTAREQEMDLPQPKGWPPCCEEFSQPQPAAPLFVSGSAPATTAAPPTSHTHPRARGAGPGARRGGARSARARSRASRRRRRRRSRRRRRT